MKEYKNRGMDWLVAYLIGLALVAVIFLIGSKTGFLRTNHPFPSFIGTAIGSGAIMLTRFFCLRAMSPQEFEAYKKRENEKYRRK